MAMAGLVGLEDKRSATAMLGEMAVEAADRQVELAIAVPGDVEVLFVERPVAGLRRCLVPRQPARLVEPEAVGVGSREIVQLGELDRADPRVEAVRDRMDGRAHRLRLMSITKRYRTSFFNRRP